jgi:hypothetical protein
MSRDNHIYTVNFGICVRGNKPLSLIGRDGSELLYNDGVDIYDILNYSELGTHIARYNYGYKTLLTDFHIGANDNKLTADS